MRSDSSASGQVGYCRIDLDLTLPPPMPLTTPHGTRNWSEQREQLVSLVGAIEGQRRFAAGGTVAEPDDIVGKVPGAGSVSLRSLAHQVAVVKCQLGCVHQLKQRGCNRRTIELVGGAEHPYQLAQDSRVNVEAIFTRERVFDHGVRTLRLPWIILRQVANEDVRIQASHFRFELLRRPAWAFATATSISSSETGLRPGL